MAKKISSCILTFLVSIQLLRLRVQLNLLLNLTSTRNEQITEIKCLTKTHMQITRKARLINLFA